MDIASYTYENKKRKNNPFYGKNKRATFARNIYKHMKSRKWFTYKNICKLDESGSTTNSDAYKEAVKAFSEIRKIMEEEYGQDYIESYGNNRNKRFRYFGDLDDPLKELYEKELIKDIREYARFGSDSAGFFPWVWIEHFLGHTFDILNIKRLKDEGRQIVSASEERNLTNIELLPIFYEAICDKNVLNIKYKPYDSDAVEIVFHPHLLKEYNGRWFLFGYEAESKSKFQYYNLALDRIEKYDILSEKYETPPKNYYNDFFRDIVGVTNCKDKEPTEIVIRATNNYIYKLTETKKIHHSQKVVKTFGMHEDGEYGEFKLFVKVNEEFISRILQMGDGLVVISPEEVRSEFQRRINKMAELYK